MPIYVIGSGLAATAAAVALVRQGCRPIVLDVGLKPDPATQMLKKRLSSVEPEDWNQEDITWLRRTGPVAANGIPRKLNFGSDHTFSELNLAVPVELCGASMYRSFAMGGFSNVWGTVIQPLSARELGDWPITARDLVPHYAAAYSLMCDRQEGTSTEIFPPEPILRLSLQSCALHSDLMANSKALESQGIRFGYPRLGIRQADKDGKQACRYCGLCLYGCPYDCTYNAVPTLTRLSDEGLIHYVPGIHVDKLIPTGGNVRIDARSVADGTLQTFRASRVLLSAGVLETARIVLVSTGLRNTPVRIKQSDIFTLPLLRYKTAGDVFSEKMHTLCQMVARVEDNTICKRPVHLQFYGYNDLYLKLLMQRVFGAGRYIAPLLRTVVARLFIIFGYLDSDDSSEIEIKLSSDGRKLLVTGHRNPAADEIVRKVALKLLRCCRLIGGVPLYFLRRLDLPGGSYHTGSTFPMRQIPKFLETDRLGRLSSLPGVHIVDASVLPDVPTSAPAFTVMANAHRIASECLK